MKKYEPMFEFHVKSLSYVDIERAISEHYGFGCVSSSFFGMELPPIKEGEAGSCSIPISFENGVFFEGHATYFKDPKSQDYDVMMSSIAIDYTKQ